MGHLIDTSVFITLERRNLSLGDLAGASPDEPVALASITASELLVGVHRADTSERRVRREKFVEAILSAVPTVPFDLGVARTHARLWAELMRAGQLIGDHDLIIAATAITHDHAVLTENARDFGRVPGLTIRSPSW